MITTPEIILHKILVELVNFIKDDFNMKDEPETTLLYNLWFGNQVGNVNYYEEAKELFLRDEGDPSVLEVRTFFDRTRAQLPTLHITLPSELGGVADGIGIDEGYEESIYNEELNEVIPVYTRSFSSQFNIVCTSSNSNSTLILYHTIKNLLLAGFNSLQLSGLKNPKLNGQDLNMPENIIPNTVFVRAISFEFFYETSAPSLFGEKFLEKIFLEKVTSLELSSDLEYIREQENNV